MATSFLIESEFPHIPLEKFLAYLNDDKLNKMLEADLDFEERKLLEKEEFSNGDKTWLFLVKKKNEVPAAIKKFLKSDAFTWHEKSRYVAAEKRIYWEIIPQMAALKMHGQGTWQLSPMKQGCKRTIQGSISVDIALVGKMLESFIVKELKASYEIEPRIQEKFYASL
jgi:hypothetical protein